MKLGLIINFPKVWSDKQVKRVFKSFTKWDKADFNRNFDLMSHTSGYVRTKPACVTNSERVRA